MEIYETTIVIDSFLKSEDQEALVKKVQNFITNNGGEIVDTEEWGKRRLAYEINKKQYGNYVHILFRAPGSLIQLLEREYRLEEPILRYLTLKSNPRALEDKAKKLEEAASTAADSESTSEVDEASDSSEEDEEKSEETKEVVEES